MMKTQNITEKTAAEIVEGDTIDWREAKYWVVKVQRVTVPLSARHDKTIGPGVREALDNAVSWARGEGVDLGDEVELTVLDLDGDCPDWLVVRPEWVFRVYDR